MVHGNIAGLYTRTHKEKVSMLFERAEENNSFIIAITESHLRKDIQDAEISMPGFQLYRADRTEGIRKGGVVVYLKNEYARGAQVLSSGSNGVVEWVSMYLQPQNTLFICLYRPPTCEVAKFQEVVQQLNRDIDGLGTPAPNVLLCGDFNFPAIRWDREEVSAGAAYRSEQARTLIEFAAEHSLEQYVKAPTRIENILDLFFANNEEMVVDLNVHENSISDHKLVIAEIALPLINAPQNRGRADGLSSLNFYHSSVNWEEINARLAAIDWRSEFNGEAVDQMYDGICVNLWNICSELVPKKKNPRRNVIPRDRRILMRKRTKWNKKYQKTRNPRIRNNITRQIQIIEDNLKTSLRKERIKGETRAVNAIKRNRKYFFSHARKKSKFRYPVGPLKVNGELIGDPKSMSNVLAQQYKSVFSTPRSGREETHDTEVENPDPLVDIDFTEEDLVKSAGRLSATSAAGPDGIAAMLLKKCITALRIPLTILWRESLRHNVIPAQMKMGTITPIFKGGSRSEPKNYRPVTLTSHIIKLFERVIVEKIMKYMDEKGLFNSRQHGFRKNRSCLSQLLQHYQSLLDILEDKSVADVIYLDFSKAFDKVDHYILLQKLEKIGIKGRLLQWIENFLTSRTQVVAVDGSLSEIEGVISGVPQGTVLGPLLFLVHIGDIDSTLRYATASSFADDTRIMMKVGSSEDCNKLQQDLESVYQWARINNMTFNENKFEHIRYGSHDYLQNYAGPDGANIRTCNQVKDLGVIISDDAKFEDQIETVVKTARQRVGWIMRVFETRKKTAMLTLYRSLVLPLVEYCCQLWSPQGVELIRKIEAVQRNFTYRIQGMRELNYWERLEQLGLYSLERRRDRYFVIYVWKIINGHAPNFENMAIETRQNDRRGLTCNIPRYVSTPGRIQTLKEGSFMVHGPRLFNEIPRDLREFEGSPETFKAKLDVFLKTVPDKPALPHYRQPASGNGLREQLAQQRRNNIYVS